jgi:uncharacterized protein (TIGR00730 family)
VKGGKGLESPWGVADSYHMKRICVFCGASVGHGAAYIEQAELLGRLLAQRGIDVVYGGGRVGLMGKVADAALAAGGKVIGIIPRALCELELDHKGLTEIHIVNSMHERKALMAQMSDGFIALPGGIGTLEEFFEVWTWAQLGIHAKACALLNVSGYFDLLLSFLDTRVVADGFVEKKSRDMVLVESDPEKLIARLKNFEAPDIRRRLTLRES